MIIRASRLTSIWRLESKKFSTLTATRSGKSWKQLLKDVEKEINDGNFLMDRSCHYLSVISKSMPCVEDDRFTSLITNIMNNHSKMSPENVASLADSLSNCSAYNELAKIATIAAEGISFYSSDIVTSIFRAYIKVWRLNPNFSTPQQHAIFFETVLKYAWSERFDGHPVDIALMVEGLVDFYTKGEQISTPHLPQTLVLLCQSSKERLFLFSEDLASSKDKRIENDVEQSYLSYLSGLSALLRTDLRLKQVSKLQIFKYDNTIERLDNEILQLDHFAQSARQIINLYSSSMQVLSNKKNDDADSGVSAFESSYSPEMKKIELELAVLFNLRSDQLNEARYKLLSKENQILRRSQSLFNSHKLRFLQHNTPSSVISFGLYSLRELNDKVQLLEAPFCNIDNKAQIHRLHLIKRLANHRGKFHNELLVGNDSLINNKAGQLSNFGVQTTPVALKEFSLSFGSLSCEDLTQVLSEIRSILVSFRRCDANRARNNLKSEYPNFNLSNVISPGVLQLLLVSIFSKISDFSFEQISYCMMDISKISKCLYPPNHIPSVDDPTSMLISHLAAAASPRISSFVLQDVSEGLLLPEQVSRALLGFSRIPNGPGIDSTFAATLCKWAISNQLLLDLKHAAGLIRSFVDANVHPPHSEEAALSKCISSVIENAYSPSSNSSKIVLPSLVDLAWSASQLSPTIQSEIMNSIAKSLLVTSNPQNVNRTATTTDESNSTSTLNLPQLIQYCNASQITILSMSFSRWMLSDPQISGLGLTDKEKDIHKDATPPVEVLKQEKIRKDLIEVLLVAIYRCATASKGSFSYLPDKDVCKVLLAVSTLHSQVSESSKYADVVSVLTNRILRTCMPSFSVYDQSIINDENGFKRKPSISLGNLTSILLSTARIPCNPEFWENFGEHERGIDENMKLIFDLASKEWIQRWVSGDGGIEALSRTLSVLSGEHIGASLSTSQEMSILERLKCLINENSTDASLSNSGGDAQLPPMKDENATSLFQIMQLIPSVFHCCPSHEISLLLQKKLTPYAELWSGQEVLSAAATLKQVGTSDPAFRLKLGSRFKELVSTYSIPMHDLVENADVLDSLGLLQRLDRSVVLDIHQRLSPSVRNNLNAVYLEEKRPREKWKQRKTVFEKLGREAPSSTEDNVDTVRPLPSGEPLADKERPINFKVHDTPLSHWFEHATRRMSPIVVADFKELEHGRKNR